MEKMENENVVPFAKQFRCSVPGVFSLADCPQHPSVSGLVVSTGWPEFDKIWKPYPGQFTVVTGVAGHGKSTLVLNLVVNLAIEKGMRSFLYVPENEHHIRDTLQKIWDGSAGRAGFETFCAEQCFIQSADSEHYPDDEWQTLDWVLDHADEVLEQNGVDLIVIDPWNELERARPRDMLMSDYIGQCLMRLKRFCRSRNVAVIMVAHPTKAGVEQGKVPTLADIEGSMNWYNKCDNGLVVVREPHGQTTRVISAKVRERDSGSRGECYFTVDRSTGVFTPQYGASKIDD